MPNYPNTEVEREVRSRVNGAMEELIRKRKSELRELAASKYAPGPGMGSGPYEQMRVGVSISFYEALFQEIVDSWVNVLTRQSGKISASDVSHVVQELEARASAAPTHIRRALASRGATALLLPSGAMNALEGGARQRMNELVAKHRRELQTRLYNQDHPHPREVPPVPNTNITKINSDNVNSTVTSGQGNQIAPITSKKGWWETWWGVVVTSVIAGLIVWGISRYFDRQIPTQVLPTGPDGKSAQISGSASRSATDVTGGPIRESGKPETVEDSPKAEAPPTQSSIKAAAPSTRRLSPSRGPSISATQDNHPKPSDDDLKEAKIQMNVASKYAKARNAEGALDALRKAVLLNPLDALAHKCLAVAYVSVHLDFGKAIKEYRLAISRPGATTDLEDRLALAIANESKVREAAQQASDADAHFELAQILEKLTVLGTRSPMNAECEKARLDPNNDPSKRNHFRVRCTEMDNNVLVENGAHQVNYDCPVN
jgi:hypothetical protein